MMERKRLQGEMYLYVDYRFEQMIFPCGLFQQMMMPESAKAKVLHSAPNLVQKCFGFALETLKNL